MSRLPSLAPEDLTEAQKRVLDKIQAGPRGGSTGVQGPFGGWLASPEFADHAQKLGALLRFGTSVPGRLKELGILYVARTWTAQFEWYAHKKIALDAGLDLDVIDAVEARRRPDFKHDDEAVVYDFCVELHETRRVSDACFEAAKKHLGEAGVSELVGVLGYYTLVSMTLNVFEVPLPEGEPLPLTLNA